MILAYLTNQYGRASDTFIRQEVFELRRRGHVVHTFSTGRPPVEHEVSDDVRSERRGTCYLIDASPLRLLASLLLALLRSPVRFALTAVTAWKTSAPGVRAHAFQLIYLVQACFLARRLGQLGVVHLHNHIAMNSATVAMLASSLSGVPWSMTVHGPHDFIEPYRWALPQKIASAGFSVFIAEFGRSQAMMLVESALWPRMHVVRCGLDESFLQFPRTRITNDAGLVFVGRLAPEKGVLLLLEAVARLVAEGVRPRLVLIGDGPSRPEVEAYIARQNLNSAVDLLGWQGADRVRAEILASRALVLPSFAEGLPIVIMEALALHRPVVSTYVAGIPELVEAGVSGLLVPAGSTDALVDAIRSIATADTELLDSWGDAGSKAVKARHDGEKSVDRLESLFLRSASGR